MARLIDDIRAAKRLDAPFWLDRTRADLWEKHAGRIFSMLDQEMPVLLIDNVAEYYMSGTDQEYWDLGRDFPNLAPPFDLFWTEHRIPHRIHSTLGDTQMTKIGAKARTGILWSASTSFKGHDIPPEAKWALMAEVFIDYDNYGRNIEGPSGSWFLLIDEHGGIVRTPFLQAFVQPHWEEVLKGFVSWMHPALLAVSFMHCRNVKLIDNTTPAPLAKKYHARTGVWPVDYHTLEIDPLKKILRHEGKSESEGLAKAMHICRGHFKDYREGAGLFGKYHQLVWQPSLIRGTTNKKDAPKPAREVTFKL